ncbi:MAG: lipoyl(octanoyl) transferase LipB [Armatimonadota bacterium]|nr:lipoyl(octanoyl) transferase LipB [Armatimonadota bacterium]
MSELWCVDLGRIGYSSCLSIQYKLAKLRAEGLIEDTLLLLEHDPVITFGRSGGEESLLVPIEKIKEAGIEIFYTDRGGDATYHGPGQLVGYPIFNLGQHGKDVHLFLRNIERSVMDCLSDFGISSQAVPGYTGVWVGDEKICSIGIAVRRWISYHGFALNVSPNFDHWALLHPCGLVGRRVTSIERLLGKPISMQSVKDVIVSRFAQVFGIKPTQIDKKTLFDRIAAEEHEYEQWAS